MKKFKFTANLKDVGKKELSLAGGKGANLGEMIKAGLPVPEGFVLLTSSYRRFVKENKLEEEIDGLLNSLDESDLSSLKQICDKIHRLFEKGDIPEEISQEIDRAYREIGNYQVVVRSSATAEDLPGTSFAGQYDTYLNVSGREELYKYIKKCWASLWNSRALSYRLKHNMGNNDLAHGVVVQKLINATKSGILFTANPVNGRRDQMLLNSSWGLGEAVVGGEVTPDQWVLDRKNAAIAEENIAKKEIMTVRKDRGIENKPVPGERQLKATLSSDEVKELFDLGEKVEKYFGFPQDIEWAFADGRMFLVQSRPITSLFPMPEPADDDDRLRIYLNMSLYSQALHEPFTPIGESVFLGMFKSFAKLLNRDYKRKPVKWCKSAGGRMFVDLTEPLRYERIWEKLKNNPADKDPVSIKALLQVVEENKDELRKDKKSLPCVAFKMITKMHPWIIKFLFTTIHKVMYGVIFPDKAASKAVQYGRNQIKRIEENVRELAETDDRLRYLEEEATKDIFIGLFEVVFYVAASTSFIEKAEKIIKKHLEDTSDLDKIEKSVPNNVTTEMGMKLLNIAKKLDAKGEKAATDHPEIIKFLDEYGHRSSNEVDIGIPRWGEDPRYVVDLVQTYIDSKSYEEGMENFYQAREEAEQAIEDISNKLKEKGASRDARKVEKLLRNYRKMFGVRELPKFYLTKAFSILREMLKDIGSELEREGKLEDKMDIFFARFDDLKARENLQEVVRENKEEYYKELNRTSVPRVVTSTGETIYSVIENESENVYSGVPVSPGVYEGVVRVLHRPEEGENLKDGEILVTKGTNPAWTPLFLKIGALVMETGGPISHGSVVAREYGVPAVAGVGSATERLTDGQKVRVNGETGAVELLSPAH